MPGDKYSAVWTSHSSISDFLACPRAYYLKNVYKDPKTKHKIQLITPPLSLGGVIHEVIESLSELPTDKRFQDPLIDKYENAWKKISGKRGGFWSPDTEARYKKRGEEMLRRVEKNPGPISRLAVKLKMDLPWFWLSEDDNIILAGKIDWLEYNEVEDSVHIIDFKTSRNEEGPDSLQLPIYNLLAHSCQKRKVSGASYWYLEKDDSPVKKELPDLEQSRTEVLKIAKKIKLARQLESFLCPHGGCNHCKPYEDILNGKAELVGQDSMRRDIYISKAESQEDDTIL